MWAVAHRSGSQMYTSMLVWTPIGTSVHTGHPETQELEGYRRVPRTSGTQLWSPKILEAPIRMSLHSQPQRPGLAPVGSIRCRPERTARSCRVPSGTSPVPREPAAAITAPASS